MDLDRRHKNNQNSAKPTKRIMKNKHSLNSRDKYAGNEMFKEAAVIKEKIENISKFDVSTTPPRDEVCLIFG